MRGRGCVTGGCAWQVGMRGGRLCVARGACMSRTPPPRYYEIRSVNERAVRILLECILVQ